MINLPPGWHDDPQKGELYFVDTQGTRWPFCFRRGFRGYVLGLLKQNTWDKRNVPLEEEHTADPMELTDSDIKPGIQQACLLTTLEWNQDRGVFEMWQGRELLETRRRYLEAQQTILAQQTQIAQLKEQLATATVDGDSVETRKILSDFYHLLSTP